MFRDYLPFVSMKAASSMITISAPTPRNYNVSGLDLGLFLFLTTVNTYRFGIARIRR